MTLRGPATLDARWASAKPLIVVKAPGFLVEAIEALNMADSDGNGAFIRLEADGDLRLRRCHVHDLQQAILTLNDLPHGRVVLEDCVFERLGDGSGRVHGIHIGRIAELRIRGGRYGGADAGDCITSRAAKTIIEGAHIHQGSGQRAIDFPNGGMVEIADCHIVQRHVTGTSQVIGYGAEGKSWPENAFHFYASNSVTSASPSDAMFEFRFEPDVKLSEAPQVEKPPKPAPPRTQKPAASRVKLADTPLDGATWGFANKALEIKWVNPGGDWRDVAGAAQGTAHYATASAKPGPVDVDVTALAKALKIENTGIHVSRVSGATLNIAPRWVFPLGNPPMQNPQAPKLKIVTDKGTFACVCIAADYIASSAGWAIAGPDLKPVTLLKFDLTALAGTVQSAVLTLTVTNVYAGGVPTLAFNLLDMPPIISDPARELGGVQLGIANEVSSDAELRNHRDVLSYSDLTDEAAIKRDYAVGAPTSTGGMVFERDAKYGFTWAHCYAAPTDSRNVAWHKWCQPVFPGKPYSRPYVFGEAHGYQEMYVRFMFRIGSDLRAAFNEEGMKLPGLAGTYNWSTSGARTLPVPRGGWETRLWHTKGSDAHPHLYRGATYFYGEPAQGNSGSDGYFNKAIFCFEAERDYCVEQHVKLNTPKPDGTYNRDGVYQVWIDGVLVDDRHDMFFRKYPEVEIQDLPFVNLYHGGMKLPKSRYHHSLASFVVSQKYIGPPTPLSRKSPPVRPPVPRNVPEKK